MKPGTWVVAMGHPGGMDDDRSVVARLGRVFRASEAVIQSDCTIIGGDSGGPLLNLDGKVVGIHSRISQGLRQNYHVPIAQYIDQWASLAAGDVWNRPLARVGVKPGGAYLGVRGADGLALGQGARLSRIMPGSPAEQAGLKPGDVVVELDHSRVGSFGDLSALVSKCSPGDRVLVVVDRKGERVALEVVVGALRR